MKKLMKRAVSMAGALLLCVSVLSGSLGFTAKAAEPPRTVVDKVNRIVNAGDVLENASMIIYVKQGMSEQAIEIYSTADDDELNALRPLLVNENLTTDIVKNDSSVRAVENGSDCYILHIYIAWFPGTSYEKRVYFLEPYTYAVTAALVQVPVYVEPAWLTDWKELLEDTDKQISEAKSGDTVVLELGEYYNISNARMQQIAEKNDVTYVLNITYENVNYRITIEPGTEIDCSFDWYGPLKLLSMFPYEIAE